MSNSPDDVVSAATRLVRATARYVETNAAKLFGVESDKVAAELRQAKAIGQFTVLSALAKLRQATTPPEPKDAPVTEAPPTDTAQGPVAAPTSIPDYDALTVQQILPYLATLTSEERALVASYEKGNRNRAAILNALTNS